MLDVAPHPVLGARRIATGPVMLTRVLREVAGALDTHDEHDPMARPRVASALVVLVASSAVACGGAEGWVALPPLTSEVESWVIASRVGDVVELFAGDHEHATRVDGGAAELELRALPVSLERLGLAPGPFVSDPSAMAPELPASRGVFAAAVTGGEAAAWRELASPVLTDAVRTPPRDACEVLTARVQSLPTTNDVRWGVTVDARTVLLGAGEARVIRVRAGGSPQLLPVVTTTIARPRAALLDSQARLWMVDDKLRLWLGRIEEDRVRGELIVGNSTLSDGLPLVLVGDVDGPEEELYTITTRGVVLRRAGAMWERFGQLPPDDSGLISHDLVWVGAGHLLASVDTEHALYRWRDGTLDRVEPGTVSTAGIVALGTLAPGVAVAATADGELSRYQEGAWQSLGPSPVTISPSAFLPHPQGFYIGGYRGAIAQWRESLGYCATPGAQAVASDTVRVFLRLGGELLATGSAPRGNGLNTYTLIEHE
jgi:hypothetical protein